MNTKKTESEYLLEKLDLLPVKGVKETKKKKQAQQQKMIEMMQLFEMLEVMLESGNSINPDSVIRSAIQLMIGKYNPNDLEQSKKEFQEFLLFGKTLKKTT